MFLFWSQHAPNFRERKKYEVVSFCQTNTLKYSRTLFPRKFQDSCHYLRNYWNYYIITNTFENRVDKIRTGRSVILSLKCFHITFWAPQKGKFSNRWYFWCQCRCSGRGHSNTFEKINQPFQASCSNIN